MISESMFTTKGVLTFACLERVVAAAEESIVCGGGCGCGTGFVAFFLFFLFLFLFFCLLLGPSTGNVDIAAVDVCDTIVRAGPGAGPWAAETTPRFGVWPCD
jgi:hypothetical protein